MDTNKSFMETYLTPIAVLVGAVILAAAYVFGSGAATTNVGPGAVQPSAADIEKVDVSDSPYVGADNAPVTMALYFDYQCPFCKQFDQVVLPQLAEYVDNGTLKVVFKDFQFLGQDSQVAAEFSRAVWELYPDQYSAWLTAMFGAQDHEGDQGFGDLASIEELTKTIPGIDVAKVTALMNEKKAEYNDLMNADRAEGASLGVNGTPAVVIGKKLLYAMTPAQFYAEIVAEIKAQTE